MEADTGAEEAVEEEALVVAVDLVAAEEDLLDTVELVDSAEVLEDWVEEPKDLAEEAAGMAADEAEAAWSARAWSALAFFLAWAAVRAWAVAAWAAAAVSAKAEDEEEGDPSAEDEEVAEEATGGSHHTRSHFCHPDFDCICKENKTAKSKNVLFLSRYIISEKILGFVKKTHDPSRISIIRV